MHLKMDKKGNVYQQGKPAEIVSHDDVAKLSNKIDPQEVKDRLTLDKIDQGQREKFIKDTIALAKLRAVRNLVRDRKTRSKQNLRAQIYRQANQHDQQIMLEAISQGSRDFERLGVSGSGRRSDGRLPYIDRPSVDWRKKMHSKADFGGLQQLGAAQDAEDFVMADLSRPYNEFDKYVIDQWEGNTYVYKYSQRKYDGANGVYVDPTPEQLRSGEARTYSQVVAASDKKNIQDQNEWVYGAQEVIDAMKRGWMWTGYYAETGAGKQWVSVKIPFTYGIPMDIPDFNNRTARDDYRQRRSHGASYTEMYFGRFKPVIDALGRQLKASGAAVDYKPIEPEVAPQKVITASQTETAEQGQTVVSTPEEIIKAQDPGGSADKQAAEVVAPAVMPSNYSTEHPMLIKGFIPRKA